MGSGHGGRSRHLFVDDEDALSEAVGLLEPGVEIALDTEFLPERRREPELCLIQIASPMGTILVDALALSDLSPLVRALGVMDWIVHGARADLQILRRLGMRHSGRIWDVQLVHGLTQAEYPLRLDALGERVAGKGVDKDLTMSDWSLRPLTRRQQRYAARDVECLPEIAKHQRAALAGSDQDRIAAFCREELDRLATEPSAPDTWVEVPGSHLLDARGVAVLRTLLTWRDEEAAMRSLPLHFVLGNPLLLYLSRSRPRQIADLEVNRRFPRPILRQHGETLLRLIDQAMDIPQADLPRNAPRDRAFLARRSFVAAWVTGFALSRSIHPDLLLPLPMRDMIARGSFSLDKLGPWRRALCGEALQQALLGTTGLRLVDGLVDLEPR
jgi:ribonuclease D